MKQDIKKSDEFKIGKKPQLFVRPERVVLCIEGQGNPNDDSFEEYIQAMYACAYTIKMAFKKLNSDTDETEITDYVVPPLQGYWTISKAAQIRGSWTKEDFVFRLEIVVPEVVPYDFAVEKMNEAKQQKRELKRIQDVYLGTVEAQEVCSILHIGPYDDEPISFKQMHEYIKQKGYKRISKDHREIYLGDVRRANPEKLRTILEVSVQEKQR